MAGIAHLQQELEHVREELSKAALRLLAAEKAIREVTRERDEARQEADRWARLYREERQRHDAR